ncbi:MAG: phage gp6-like head-tail connector protein [Clostridiales bacterium]|nr:phage gp6-like head-tail connector protein [Clostridiales bacterium]
MIDLEKVKSFLRVDADDEDELIQSLITTASELTADILRRPLADFEPMPETIQQAICILVATLYEERQASKDKTGLDMAQILDLIRRMLFAYRKDRF